MNNKFLCCFLDLGMTDSFMIPQVVERLKLKTKVVSNPITMHLAQGVAKPLFRVALGVKLFYGGVKFLRTSPCVI